MSSTLPTELYGHIFNLLEHRSSLYSCRLVCTQWHACTMQTSLFRHVKVTNANADGFASLLINSKSTLPLSIYKLTLEVNPGWLRRLLPFLQSLTNIRHLTLRNLDWAEIGPHTSSQLTSIYSNSVQQLTLGPGTRFPSLKDTTVFIEQFSRIDKLVVDSVCWNATFPSTRIMGYRHRGEIIPDHLRPLPRNCKNISFKNCSLRDVYHWLVSHKQLPEISTLALEDVTLEDIIFQRGICFAFRTKIRDLSLSYNACPSMQAVVDSCAITHQKYSAQGCDEMSSAELAFPQSSSRRVLESRMVPNADIVLPLLTTVRLGNFVYFTDRSRTGAIFYGMESLAFFLCRMPYSQLKNLHLGIVLHRAADIDQCDINWELLDRMLRRPAPLTVDKRNIRRVENEGLDKIIFEVGGGADLEGVEALMKKRLPQCSDAKILQFQTIEINEK
ncbi:hypothetical protein CPB83DRAFT_949022 [Crepidotus variabilis]|uniref:F-box domain-containing protein n=1 Tax=Crepidotus variabilis TaxID=179855 RepID=A0A9P6E7N8_9AGAR|nr:hypothetical protein CPB83DRAFT_949022 [Crepidotus variabilis]